VAASTSQIAPKLTAAASTKASSFFLLNSTILTPLFKAIVVLAPYRQSTMKNYDYL
jgi:hypothetical protein